MDKKDQLSTARGIANGLWIGAVMWVWIIYAVVEFIR